MRDFLKNNKEPFIFFYIALDRIKFFFKSDNKNFSFQTQNEKTNLFK